MYCTAPLNPRKWRLRSFRDDDDEGQVDHLYRGDFAVIGCHNPRHSIQYLSNLPSNMVMDVDSKSSHFCS